MRTFERSLEAVETECDTMKTAAPIAWITFRVRQPGVCITFSNVPPRGPPIAAVRPDVDYAKGRAPAQVPTVIARFTAVLFVRTVSNVM